jgi:predicted DNA-binding transcriptional regulator YafY
LARNDRTIRLELVKKALIASRVGVSLKTLAERHNWKLRALYRDVDALEASNYHIVRAGGRLRIDGELSSLSGVPDAEERLALYLARDQARGWKGTALGKALDRLWHRVSSSGDGQAALLPVDSTPWITVREGVLIDYTNHQKIVAVLEQATRDRRAVRVRYRAASTGVVTERVIEPGQLHWDSGLGSLYLIGWCRLRKAVRVFAVHRFVAALVLDDVCPPRADTRSKVALNKAFRLWCDKNVYTVSIWFSDEVESEIGERTWLADQVINKGDGGVILSGRVAGLAEITRWVLGYAGAARVLEPAAFVEKVATALREAAVGYGPRVGARAAKRAVGKTVAR